MTHKKVSSDTAVKALKPAATPYRRAVGKGLSVHVLPNGTRRWVYRYRFHGVEKSLGLGVYPDVQLKEARARRDAARTLLAQDPPVDPSAAKKAAKVDQSNTFTSVAGRWFKGQGKILAESTKVRDERILNKLTDRIGSRPLSELESPEILAALRAIQKTGGENAHRALGMARRIFGYALAEGLATRDATAGLRAGLDPRQSTQMSAITDPKQFGQLLRDIDAYGGFVTTRIALQLLSLTFLRPGELRQARWPEFDLAGEQWVIPAERMKMRREHIVPLAKQSLALLKELRQLTGDDAFVFQSGRKDRPLSENAFSTALKTMGYTGDVHQPHGFRSSASTILHELEQSHEVIETQLAHSRPGVGGIYNRSHLLPQRRALMQFWADHCNAMKSDV